MVPPKKGIAGIMANLRPSSPSATYLSFTAPLLRRRMAAMQSGGEQMKNVERILLTVVMSLGISACSHVGSETVGSSAKSESNPLLGRWKETKISVKGAESAGDRSITEFRKDGTFAGGGSILRYRVIDDNRVEIDHYSYKETLRYKTYDNRLEMECLNIPVTAGCTAFYEKE
jgi:hypothetical protein